MKRFSLLLTLSLIAMVSVSQDQVVVDSSKSTTQKTDRLTTSVQCNGITQKGLRCKNKTLNASGYCYLHEDQIKTKQGSDSKVSSAPKQATTVSKPATSGTYNGKQIHTGPRGGQYYINSNGNKTYIKRK